MRSVCTPNRHPLSSSTNLTHPANDNSAETASSLFHTPLPCKMEVDHNSFSMSTSSSSTTKSESAKVCARTAFVDVKPENP